MTEIRVPPPSKDDIKKIARQNDCPEDHVDRAATLASQNPGAVVAITHALQELDPDERGAWLDTLHDKVPADNGPLIWVGFKDHCDTDVEDFIALVRGQDIPCAVGQGCLWCHYHGLTGP